MLTIQPISYRNRNANINIQNNKTFKSNPIKRIKATPETAMQLSLTAALSSFFAKFFAEDASKNLDRQASLEELQFALELDMMKNTNVEEAVELLTEEEFENSVADFRENGIIVENREDLKTVLKDSVKRSEDEFWVEKGQKYWKELSARIDSNSMTKRDSKFLEGMAKAKEENFDKEFDKFEIII